MTKREAHELLNAARLGALVSRHAIVAALIVTGDLMPSYSTPKYAPTWIVPRGAHQPMETA
jgi:hypothetical protein